MVLENTNCSFVKTSNKIFNLTCVVLGLTTVATSLSVANGGWSRVADCPLGLLCIGISETVSVGFGVLERKTSM